MEPWFLAKSRFGPWDGDSWKRFIDWSGLDQIEELVSLDSMLCDDYPGGIDDVEYWDYVANYSEGQYFLDLSYLMKITQDAPNRSILCVFLNPERDPAAPTDVLPFEFAGYDLVETDGSISSLSNCGGFPDEFANSELNRFGLLSSRERAFEVQRLLRERHPQEPHADCNVWALFRAIA